MELANLGPAERIIQALLVYHDHAYHGRPGIVTKDAAIAAGVRWEPVTHKEENGQKVVYKLVKQGKKTVQVRMGVLQPNNDIVEGGTVRGVYRAPGLFNEVCAHIYRQIAEVWKLDNEFAARWASHAFGEENRDLKVMLAAFMLVQSRKGDPVIDAGKVAFHDEDFRDVGEAMLLLYEKPKGKDDKKKNFDPKLLLRVRNVLAMPEIAAINRELGFGRSARNPFFGRWQKAAEKWLQFREENPKLLESLVKAGFKRSVKQLVRLTHYKPSSPKFFEIIGWNQKQAPDGRREIAIGQTLSQGESWEDLTEEQICQKIVQEKLSFKRVVGLLPKKIGVTRAIFMATVEAGGLSNKDLLIATPTIEELGLLEVQEFRERWERAVKEADDMRAANIATRVKSKAVEEKLQEAADNALKSAVEEVTKDLRVYVMVDISGSMEGAIEAAKGTIARFVQAFPLDRLHVAVFNTSGREIRIQHQSAAGVNNAFRGVMAGGGTDYGSGIRVLQQYKPGPTEDVLFIFIGDEGDSRDHFTAAVEASGLRPLAFGLIPVTSPRYGRGDKVRQTARRLGIPCFEMQTEMFADPYAIPRTLRNLIAATPVAIDVQAVRPVPRETLVDKIVRADLLKKPAWAA